MGCGGWWVSVDLHLWDSAQHLTVCPTNRRAKSKREIRHANEEYVLKNGRRVYVLAQGRLVNLAAAEGHPSEVMDMSFANQYLALCKLAKEGKNMKPGVSELPPEQDQELARIKLTTQGLSIDALTPEQIAYNDDYAAGT